MPNKVSIIIPSRSEKAINIQRTLESIYANATGDFEVLLGFDGPPYVEIPRPHIIYPNLSFFIEPQTIGLKAMINKLAERATGKYILKLDAHCAVGAGFDEILVADMQDNWVVTPRFYVLDGKTWLWQDDRFYDYFYLSCPFTDPKGLRFKAGGHWPQRTQERLADFEGDFKEHKYDIDETPQMHGSCWFVNRDFFLNEIGGFPTDDPFGHAQEPPYLGLKIWLGPWDGKLMVNKKTWYAHLHQDSKERGYPEDKAHTERTYNDVASYWLGNKWSGRVHDFDFFVKKFMPMPTWPENWEELYEKWKGENK